MACLLSAAGGLLALEGRPPAQLEEPRAVDASEQLPGGRHGARPAGLMAGPDARAGVAVEIFEEEQVVPPVGIGLELLRPTEHRPAAVRVAQEDAHQAARDLSGDLEEVHLASGSGGALHLE